MPLHNVVWRVARVLQALVVFSATPRLVNKLTPRHGAGGECCCAQRQQRESCMPQRAPRRRAASATNRTRAQEGGASTYDSCHAPPATTLRHRWQPHTPTALRFTAFLPQNTQVYCARQQAEVVGVSARAQATRSRAGAAGERMASTRWACARKRKSTTMANRRSRQRSPHESVRRQKQSLLPTLTHTRARWRNRTQRQCRAAAWHTQLRTLTSNASTCSKRPPPPTPQRANRVKAAGQRATSPWRAE